MQTGNGFHGVTADGDGAWQYIIPSDTTGENEFSDSTAEWVVLRMFMGNDLEDEATYDSHIVSRETRECVWKSGHSETDGHCLFGDLNRIAVRSKTHLRVHELRTGAVVSEREWPMPCECYQSYRIHMLPINSICLLVVENCNKDSRRRELARSCLCVKEARIRWASNGGAVEEQEDEQEGDNMDFFSNCWQLGASNGQTIVNHYSHCRGKKNDILKVVCAATGNTMWTRY
jgi:hypothetical protein